MKRTQFYIFGFSALMLCDTLTQISFKLASNHGGEFAMQLAWFLSIFLSLGFMGRFLGI